MAGETLVEKCREIDHTDETEDKANPVREQLPRYRLLLEEWQKRNEVVKDVLEGKTRFETEGYKLFRGKFDGRRQEMIYQCIAGVKEVHERSKIAEAIGGVMGLALCLGIGVPAISMTRFTRRNLLRICGITVGSVAAGCASGFVVSFGLQANKKTETYFQNVKYLDNVVDYVRKK